MSKSNYGVDRSPSLNPVSENERGIHSFTSSLNWIFIIFCEKKSKNFPHSCRWLLSQAGCKLKDVSKQQRHLWQRVNMIQSSGVQTKLHNILIEILSHTGFESTSPENLSTHHHKSYQLIMPLGTLFIIYSHAMLQALQCFNMLYHMQNEYETHCLFFISELVIYYLHATLQGTAVLQAFGPLACCTTCKMNVGLTTFTSFLNWLFTCYTIVSISVMQKKIMNLTYQMWTPHPMLF